MSGRKNCVAMARPTREGKRDQGADAHARRQRAGNSTRDTQSRSPRAARGLRGQCGSSPVLRQLQLSGQESFPGRRGVHVPEPILVTAPIKGNEGRRGAPELRIKGSLIFLTSSRDTWCSTAARNNPGERRHPFSSQAMSSRAQSAHGALGAMPPQRSARCRLRVPSSHGSGHGGDCHTVQSLSRRRQRRPWTRTVPSHWDVTNSTAESTLSCVPAQQNSDL